MPGRGIEGTVGDQRYILGSATLIAEAGGTVPNLPAPLGTSLSYLAKADGTLLGAFAFTDTARPDAAAAIATLRASGRAVMLLSGDRAPAAQAMGAALGIADIAADVAIEAADIALLRPDLTLVPTALALSAKTRRVLRQGLFWAMIYNLIGIPLAAAGVLTPVAAAAAMAASSVSVLANALRLRRAV